MTVKQPPLSHLKPVNRRERSNANVQLATKASSAKYAHHALLTLARMVARAPLTQTCRTSARALPVTPGITAKLQTCVYLTPAQQATSVGSSRRKPQRSTCVVT